MPAPDKSAYDHLRMSWSRDKGRIWSGLKRNYAIWPLMLFAFGFAPAMIVFMIFHKGKHPEAIWTTKNPEPWNDWQNRREKLLSFVDFDYKNYKPERPVFEYKKD